VQEEKKLGNDLSRGQLEGEALEKRFADWSRGRGHISGGAESKRF